jgi:hypothetical protein
MPVTKERRTVPTYLISEPGDVVAQMMRYYEKDEARVPDDHGYEQPSRREQK